MKIKHRLELFLIVTLVFASFAGCAEKKFSYSDGIDKNGFYENTRALDFVELGDYR